MSFSTLFHKRLDPRIFSGLPLLLLSIVFLILLFVFIDLIEDIVTSDRIVQLDTTLNALIATMRTPFLTSVFLFITELGNTMSMIWISSVAALSYCFFCKRRYTVSFLLTALGSTLSVQLLKLLIARDRPDLTLAFYAEKLYSFPSGHSATTLAIFGFITYVWIRTTHSSLLRIGIGLGTVLLVGAVGFSRMYLGVHYLSDVVGGYILGALWLIIGICITELLHKRT